MLAVLYCRILSVWLFAVVSHKSTILCSLDIHLLVTKAMHLTFFQTIPFPLTPFPCLSSYSDLKESCSKSRAISLAIYTWPFQARSMCEESLLFMTEDDIHYYYFLSVQTPNSSWVLSPCQGQLPSPNSSSTSGASFCLWQSVYY